MNRLVIIGNGFDLAHGLPTSYRDFIEDYFIETTSIFFNEEKYNDDFILIKYKTNNIYNPNHKFKNIDEVFSFFKAQSEYVELVFNNPFFENLVDVVKFVNWVDIENDYYKKLKDIVKSNDLERIKKINVEQLNKEFDLVKNLFEEYLAKKVNIKSAFEEDNSNVNEILSFFKIQFKYLNNGLSVENKEAMAYIKEFNNEDLDDLESFDFKIIEASKKGSLHDDLKDGIIQQNNLFLNFNYTSTINNYIKLLDSGNYCGKVEEVQIHGRLFDYKNKINFGFGDEMDDDYKLIENINENEYLKNFKSFGYIHNLNYRKLLDFIDYDKFQVFIMGHSCGLSDRTLLNTIFEHNNCRSIKVFFHEYKDKETKKNKDNFTELVQNISRHFNDKKLMRSKVVNKTSSKPLPQKQFPKKES